MTKLTDISAARPLVLVGCGKMGGALLQGWLKGGLTADAVYVIDPFVDNARAMVPGLAPEKFYDSVAQLPKDLTPGFIVLAVKPQMMDQALEDLKGLTVADTVFLSIAAGKTINYFTEILGLDAAVVRAMPNTPAAIGRGITVGYANRNVTDSQKATCHELLKAAGVVDWVTEEGLIDAVTAVSGSGPAYVFHLVEALAGAGETLGLDKELAQKLATHTICGAGALLEQSADDATQLRKNVTSPNGTTEAALNILMRDEGLGKLMVQTVRAAYQRSRELAD
ncbi:pyrroline-5-carboxylate reductase [Paremcibacter congregatus]|uniref:Pyrroline-5-carboxylate reductase n=1 Tax=Paremcibacter congregatus TaxID=2043170 RepID=A0A2G4YVE6_9PROT|nr:pyrroline-5-carboxylate reductase [Paremcibacter congregatus]PHZ86253.1 pyrroline-5-carboxylate reductase [Paremcibacter congregatus]QDE27220.1 pyrroline-5-carboxylate reductase [Paremcibacter congregatus]